MNILDRIRDNGATPIGDADPIIRPAPAQSASADPVAMPAPNFWTTRSQQSGNPLEAIYDGAAAFVTHPLLSGLLHDSKSVKETICGIYGEILLLCCKAKQKGVPFSDQWRDTEKNIREFLQGHIENNLQQMVLLETPEERTARLQDADSFARIFCTHVRDHANALLSTPLTTLYQAPPRQGSASQGGLPLLHASR